MQNKYISKRIGATLIDYTIVYAFTILYIIAFGQPEPDGSRSINGLPALVPTAFWFIFIVITEAYLDGTVGHQIFRLKVVSTDKYSMSFGKTIKRRLCDALDISLCFGLVAYLLVKNSQTGQRLGDQVAKTMVISKQDASKQVIFDFEQNQTT